MLENDEMTAAERDTRLASWLAIAGVPPFSGFWSKGDVLMNAYARSPALYAAGLLTALLTAYYMGRVVFLTFYGPGGFATPDDVAALEAVQQGFSAWRDVEWNDLSRGMARNDEQQDTDEGHLRVFWRRWSELMEKAA